MAMRWQYFGKGIASHGAGWQGSGKGLQMIWHGGGRGVAKGFNGSAKGCHGDGKVPSGRCREDEKYGKEGLGGARGFT